MPHDPRQIWEYFAKAAIQEHDPRRLTYLMRELHRALDREVEKPKPKPRKSDKRT